MASYGDEWIDDDMYNDHEEANQYENVEMPHLEVATATTLEEFDDSMNEYSHSDEKTNLLSFDPFRNNNDDSTSSAPQPERYFLPGDIRFVHPTTSLSPVFKAILDGRKIDAQRNRQESHKYYKENVLQVDPFDIVTLEADVDGTQLSVLPHQFACLVGNVSYLDAILECLKTPEEFKSIINIKPYQKNMEVQRNWETSFKLRTKENDDGDEKQKRSPQDRSPFAPLNPADFTSFPNAGMDLLLLTHPDAFRPIEEFACRLLWDYGSSVILPFLLKNGILDAFRDTNTNRRPPLYVAAQMGDVKVFDFLEKNHLSPPPQQHQQNGDNNQRLRCVNWKDEKNGENLFHGIAGGANYEMLKYLIDNKCESQIDAVMQHEEEGKQTPFSWCCTFGQFSESNEGDTIKCLELFMQNGAHLYCIKEREMSSGKTSATNNILSKLTNLGQLENNNNNNNNTTGEQSLSEKFEALFKERDIFVKLNHFPPIRMITFEDFTKFLKKTKSDNVESFLKQYFESFQQGASNNSTSTVTHIYIIEKTKTRQFYTSPLHCACSRGCTKVVRWLCANGFDVDKNVKAPNSVLYESVRCGDGFACSKFLIEELKVNLDDFNEGNEKFTCCYAASYLPSRTDTLRLMLQNGANASLVTSSNATPAFGAVFGTNLEALKILVEFNCDISTPFSGHSLLSYTTAMGGRADIIQFLERIM